MTKKEFILMYGPDVSNHNDTKEFESDLDKVIEFEKLDFSQELNKRWIKVELLKNNSGMYYMGISPIRALLSDVKTILNSYKS